jgi:hypothetical protein
MLKIVKDIVYFFSAEAEYERYQSRMYNFLSQATDRIHLEQLEKEWDRINYKQTNNLIFK